MKSVLRMPRTSGSVVKTYEEKFPFLTHIIGWLNSVWYIGVEQIDLDLLELVPAYETCGYFGGWKQLAYLVIEGEALPLNILSLREKHKSSFAIWRPSTWWAQTEESISVKLALIRIGATRLGRLQYIVLVTNPEASARIQIFKLPKRFSLQEWSEVERMRLRQELDQQVAAS